MSFDTAGTESLDALERYLYTASVLSIETMREDGYHKGKFKLHLHGGVPVMVKPADGVLEGPWFVSCEAGAWKVARLLGYTDLVPATVLRDVPTPAPSISLASLQILVPGTDPGIWSDEFEPLTVLRAGVFDFIMGQVDRAGHNWLTTRPQQGRRRFYLHDNGFACLHPMAPAGLASRFFDEAEGEPLPESVLRSIEGFLKQVDGSALKLTLPTGTYAPMIERAEHLLRVGALVRQPAPVTRTTPLTS